MEKISKLLLTLLDRTEKCLVAWQETADEDVFQYSIADSPVSIADFGGSYSVSIFNGSGRTVDVASDEDLDKAVNLNSSGGENSHRHLMERLHSAARRKALQAEATLDGILTKLGVEA